MNRVLAFIFATDDSFVAWYGICLPGGGRGGCGLRNQQQKWVNRDGREMAPRTTIHIYICIYIYVYKYIYI